MKCFKSTVKSIASAAVIGAGLLIATSAFAGDHDRHRDRDDRHGRYDHHRGWGNDNWAPHRHGDARFVIPLPPHPPVFIPIPHPPRVSFSIRAPEPVFVTFARVIDVDPIITRVPINRSRRNWDDDYGDDFKGDRRGRDCDERDLEYSDRIDGYRVTYVYRGREYMTRMSYDPGDRIRIRVGNGIEVLQ